MTNHFISVDWGTSNLRIKLVEVPSLEIVEQLVFNEGIKHVFDAWKAKGGDRADYFLHFLKEKIQLLKNPSVGSNRIIISGMASSRIGLRELPYAELPFGTDGKGIYLEQIQRTDILSNPISLISGVRGPNEVMRGEEVQILGLTGENASKGNTIYILPGTHSKHIQCSAGHIVNFSSYMTGEVFQVMATHSILSGSIEKTEPNESRLLAFDEGVLKHRDKDSILHTFFTVRTSSLLGTRSKEENYFYLSGLLIGEELKSLQKIDQTNIRLCADGMLFTLYRRALERLGLLHKTELIAEQDVRLSVIRGQWELMKYNNW